jgi:hypothetical protein
MNFLINKFLKVPPLSVTSAAPGKPTGLPKIVRTITKVARSAFLLPLIQNHQKSTDNYGQYPVYTQLLQK